MLPLSKGFVLYILLFFSTIYLSLVFYLLNSNEHFLKLLKSKWHTQEATRQRENLMHHLIQQTIPTPNKCVVQPMATLYRKNIPWWKSHACVGNFNKIRYYYLIENLGNFSCTKIYNLDNKQWITAQFYRFSLILMTPSPVILLQTVVAFPAKLNTICKTKTNFISRSLQMQREFKIKELFNGDYSLNLSA